MFVSLLRSIQLRELSVGLRDAATVMPSFGIYGAVWGSLAREAGFSVSDSVAMSVLVCAGTAQFAVLPVLSTGASVWTLVMTTYIVNLPNYLMAASLAPYFTGFSRGRLALLAHGISNSTYALTQARFARNPANATYFISCTVAVYLAWCLGTLVGALLGDRIPDPQKFGLDFVFPAVFIAIAARTIRSRRDWAVAGVAAIAAVALAWQVGGTLHIAVAGLGAAILAMWRPSVNRPRAPTATR